MTLARHLPNLLTCCNIACGMAGILAIANGYWQWAPYFVWCCGLFDFADGLAARALRATSPLGKQLDSLADLVSFGVLPAFAVYGMMQQFAPPHWYWVPWLAIVMVVASALRLALFNIDERQTTEFRGLNTPANALLISGLVFWLPQPENNAALLLGLLAIMATGSALLLVQWRFFSFKLTSWVWAANRVKYVFLVASFIVAVTYLTRAISIIIILYILLSFINHLFNLESKAPQQHSSK